MALLKHLNSENLKSSIFYSISLKICLFLSLGSCVTEYDFDRAQPERGSFGEEVYRTLHQDTQWSPREPEARRKLLERSRADIISSLDLMVPPHLLDPLEETLRLLAPLHDSELIPNFTHKISQILLHLSQQMSLLDKVSSRRELRGDKAYNVHSAVLERVVNFSCFDELIDLLITTILENDGFNEQGQIIHNEAQLVTQLTRSLAVNLSSFNVSGNPRRLAVFLNQFLLWDDRLLQAEEVNVPSWVTRLDSRGLPQVRLNRLQDVYAPFVDFDGDKLPDVDQEGNWLDLNQQKIKIKAFSVDEDNGGTHLWLRDGIGRAYASTEEFLFDYVDLNQTILNFLLRESRILIEKEVFFDSFDVLRSLLPERLVRVDEEGSEIVYYSEFSNLPLDLVHAIIEIFSFVYLDELLELSASVIREGSNLLADLILSIEYLSDAIEDEPNTELLLGNTLLEDLLEASEPLMRPEIIEELLISMQDPVVAECGSALLDLLTYYADHAAPPSEGLYNNCFQLCESQSDLGSLEHFECVRSCPSGEIFRNMITTGGQEHRSHLERTLALFRTTSGLSYEMKVLDLSVPFAGVDLNVEESLPPLLRINDVAAAYIEAVAGELFLADYVTEEAIASPEVNNRLLGGIERICGSSAFESLVTSLVNVTAEELGQTCDLFEQASLRSDLSEEERKRQRIAITITLLSKLTDVSIDQNPSAGQLTRFFNTPNPSLNLSIASLSLSQLIDKDGYYLWENHGDMLFAVEASGLLDCIQPIFKVLWKQGQTATFARIAATLDAHYPTPERVIHTAEGSLAPRTGIGTGLVRYEPALRSWLSHSKIFSILRELSQLGDELQSWRAQKFNTILSSFISYLMTPNIGFTRRDGTSTHLRADLRSIPLSPFWMFYDVINQARDLLNADQQVQPRWDRVINFIVERAFEVELTSDGAHFTHPEWLSFAQGLLEVSAKWTYTERGLNQLRYFVREQIYSSIKDFILGKELPLIVDLYDTILNRSDRRSFFIRFARHMLADDALPSLQTKIYEILSAMSDESYFVNFAHLLSLVIDPKKFEFGFSDPSPLISHGALLWQKTKSLAPQSPLVEIIKGSLNRSPLLSSPYLDPKGAEPLLKLLNIILDYHRQIPDSLNELKGIDYELILSEISRWLVDKDRGLIQVYQLVKLRL